MPYETIHYATPGGGRRLHPLLVLATSELGDAGQSAVEQTMTMIGVVHVYSSAHDDTPAMDNDSLRHSKPTCHMKYGEATAPLVGSALQTQTFDVLSRPIRLPTKHQIAMLSTLTKASSSLGTTDGQAIDLANAGEAMNQAQLKQMHGLKAGALTRTAVVLGMLACPGLDSDDVRTLDNYAAKLGSVFQVIDDVLDCKADTATLGKTTGKDNDNDKLTYVKLMGLRAARVYAGVLTAGATTLLEPFDTRALQLNQLVQSATARENQRTEQGGESKKTLGPSEGSVSNSLTL